LALSNSVTPWISTPIRPEADAPGTEVARHRLLERTTYIDAPPGTVDWELPVMPLTGRTWPPGSKASIPNAVRLARAVPKFIRCLAQAPRLTFQAVNPAEYGYQARSLSTLYRLARLCAERKPFDVVHAHFGPVANSFRFARQLWRAPFCASFHGYDFSTLPRRSGAGMYQKLFADADVVTVNRNIRAGWGWLPGTGCIFFGSASTERVPVLRTNTATRGWDLTVASWWIKG
jgi:hypothetical protein